MKSFSLILYFGLVLFLFGGGVVSGVYCMLSTGPGHIVTFIIAIACFVAAIALMVRDMNSGTAEELFESAD